MFGLLRAAAGWGGVVPSQLLAVPQRNTGGRPACSERGCPLRSGRRGNREAAVGVACFCPSAVAPGLRHLLFVVILIKAFLKKCTNSYTKLDGVSVDCIENI